MKAKPLLRGVTPLIPLLICVLLLVGAGCAGGNHNGAQATAHEEESPEDAHSAREHAQTEGRHLELDAHKVKQWGVESTPAVMRRFLDRLELTGEIHENENTSFRVQARVAGVVKRVYRDLGDQVRRHDVLCLLSSDELLRMRTRFVKAVQVFHEAEADFQRARRLQEINAMEARRLTIRETAYKTAMAELISLEADLREVGENGKTLEILRQAVSAGNREALREFLTPHYRILAPAPGRIAARDLLTGQSVTPDTALFEIIDQRRVWALLDLLEKDMALVAAGTPVRITSDAYPGISFSGRVSVIMPRMDRRLRSVKVRVVVENPHLRLRTGHYVKGWLDREEGEPMVAVPATALSKLFGVDGVFLAEPEGFHFLPVKVKGEDDAGFAYVEGLKPGTMVAYRSVYLLKAELELRAGGGGDAHEGHSH